MKFLVEWNGRWGSQIISDEAEALLLLSRGAVITLLDAVTDAGEIGTCCRIVEPRKDSTPDTGAGGMVITRKTEDE